MLTCRGTVYEEASVTDALGRDQHLQSANTCPIFKTMNLNFNMFVLCTAGPDIKWDVLMQSKR